MREPHPFGAAINGDDNNYMQTIATHPRHKKRGFLQESNPGFRRRARIWPLITREVGSQK